MKKLQKNLINAGYDVGENGADGIYGEATENAVKQYQTDNDLTVDGVAGDETMSHFNSASDASDGNTKTTIGVSPAGAESNFGQYTYHPENNQAYQQAMGMLTQAQGSAPTYAGTYESQLQEAYNAIVNRKKFSYDLDADALYQQYKDAFTNQGKMAMRDTMGQAAALTGGYGSSYAQSVGQQQYDAYLQRLNDVIPELYDRALAQYGAEGDALREQYAMLGEMRDNEYGMYQDEKSEHWQNVGYWTEQANNAYERGYENWYNAAQMGTAAGNTAWERQQAEENTAWEREQTESNTAYERQQNAYENLVTLITTTGYTPTAEELTAAGMSEAQAKAYLSYYNQNNKKSSGSSGGGGGGKSSGSNGSTNWYEIVKANAASAAADGKTTNAQIIGDIAAAYADGKITAAQAAQLEAIYAKGTSQNI